MELEQIIKWCKVPASNMLWVHREIEDIKEHLTEEIVKDFIDVEPMSSSVDEIKKEILDDTKSKLVNLVCSH